MGIIPLLDKETGKTIWVNTSSEEFQANYLATYSLNQEKIAKICRKFKANFLTIYTDEDYVPQLVNLFRLRHKIRKNG